MNLRTANGRGKRSRSYIPPPHRLTSETWPGVHKAALIECGLRTPRPASGATPSADCASSSGCARAHLPGKQPFLPRTAPQPNALQVAGLRTVETVACLLTQASQGGGVAQVGWTPGATPHIAESMDSSMRQSSLRHTSTQSHLIARKQSHVADDDKTNEILDRNAWQIGAISRRRGRFGSMPPPSTTSPLVPETFNGLGDPATHRRWSSARNHAQGQP